jgi:hypothetical protein
LCFFALVEVMDVGLVALPPIRRFGLTCGSKGLFGKNRRGDAERER